MESLKGRDHSEDLCGWEFYIMMVYREIGWEVVDWFELAQDKDWWRSLVNMALNLWILYILGHFLTS